MLAFFCIIADLHLSDLLSYSKYDKRGREKIPNVHVKKQGKNLRSHVAAHAAGCDEVTFEKARHDQFNLI